MRSGPPIREQRELYEMTQGDSGELSTLSEDPECRETALPALDSWITPTERFYVRNHFSQMPDADASTWRLSVEGEVETPLDLGYEELSSLPARTVVATLECAGNSRSYLTPPAEGISFRHGAVGNAEWTGVPLRELLSRARPKPDTVEVLFKGADSGEEEEEGVKLEIDYARSLPLEKALDHDTLVAYQMNGETLQPVHGYPLRLIVPGWYGMASVKWLRRITVLATPYEGFFQSRRYVYIPNGEAQPNWQPVTSLQVKSLITRPRHGEVVRPGEFTVQGVAWSEGGGITRIELSTDGGRSWQEADLFGPQAAGAWRRWKSDWLATTPGHFILMCRAVDSRGNTQPASMPWNFRGYANNSIHSIAVEVP
jgi:DMSO/TMAO reductase YedYZ molybdopterin-dependent catalytic subunit